MVTENENTTADGMQPAPERRRFLRIPFQKNISYRICYDKFTSSEKVEGSSRDISTGGIMFKTKWPPPLKSFLVLDVDLEKTRRYVQEQKLTDQLDLNELYVQQGKVYGEVVRVREYPESGFFDVAVRLIYKKEYERKNETVRKYISPDIPPQSQEIV